MIIRTFILLTIAAVNSAAIFLFGERSVSFVKGTVESIHLDINGSESINKVEKDDLIGSNYVLATGKSSRIEIKQKDKFWRVGSLSVAKWNLDNELWLHSGSALFCTTSKTEIKFSTSKCQATFEGSGTIIIEATKNGGFKFIPLESKGTITTVNGGTKEIVGGRMLLVLGTPSYFGDAYDIDLLLLIKSSRLLNAFPDPLPTFKKIGLALYVQDLKLKGKYDALIGDATTDENLQIWKFGENPTNQSN